MIINQNYKGNARQQNILMVLPGVTEKQSNSRQKKVYSIFQKQIQLQMSHAFKFWHH